MSFLSDALDFVSNIGGSIMDSIGSAITDAIATVAGKGVFYILVDGLLSIVKAFWELFSVFAGITKVDYYGKKDYLISLFFSNQEVRNIYWGMALIGMIMAMLFAIIAVIRKTFDLHDKQQRPIGAILGSTAKGFLIILLLSWFMSTMISASNMLMQQVTYLFNNSKTISQPKEYTYTEQQFATMARVLNTVGNYSLNPSSNSRYNLNSCFNEIRPDLYELQQQGVFSQPYEVKNDNGETLLSWQSALQKVVNSADLRRDLKIDIYYEGPATALTELMELLQKNPSMRPLSEYRWSYGGQGEQAVSIDRILFLMSTQDAAKNPEYNKNPTFTDAVRAPYYYGEKSIYSISDVMDSFDIKIGVMSYVMLAFVSYVTLKNLWRCIIQCIARIFSLLGLYIVAPPFIATMPMDDGEKFKQWMTAFIIQMFGIFGTVIPMRLVIMLVPMIFDPNLHLFDSSVLDLLARILLLVGGLEATGSFGGMVTGMLASNVGFQAIGATEKANATADATFAKGQAAVVGGAKIAGNAALGTAKVASNITGLTTIGRGISSAVGAVTGAAGDANSYMAEHGGIIGAMFNGITGGGGGGGASLPASNSGMRSTPTANTAAQSRGSASSLSQQLNGAGSSGNLPPSARK